MLSRDTQTTTGSVNGALLPGWEAMLVGPTAPLQGNGLLFMSWQAMPVDDQ